MAQWLGLCLAHGDLHRALAPATAWLGLAGTDIGGALCLSASQKKKKKQKKKIKEIK